MNVCKKNVVLPREWAGIVVGIWSHHGMPRFECFSCSETAFVDYGGVVKVNGMVMPYSMTETPMNLSLKLLSDELNVI